MTHLTKYFIFNNIKKQNKLSLIVINIILNNKQLKFKFITDY